MFWRKESWKMVTSSNLYEEISKDKLYLKVADFIQNLILTQQLHSGDRLPPERDLAEHMGLSRTAVREAIKTLQERGLIEVIPGNGTFVTSKETVAERVGYSLNLVFQLESRSIKHLQEVREALEVNIAALAAERATPEHIERMRAAIEEMDRSLDSPDDYVKADLLFHSVLAQATGNPLFLALVNSVVDLLREARLFIFKSPGAPSRGQKWHWEILRCIEAKDSNCAKNSMKQHLAQAFEDLKAGMVLAGNVSGDQGE